LKLIGRDPRFLDSITGKGVAIIGGVRVSWDGSLLVLATIALFVVLVVYLRKTWSGRAMLMTAESRTGSELQGVNVVQRKFKHNMITR